MEQNVHELQSKNAELVQHIASLKLQLGVSAIENDKSRARLEKVFRQFDKSTQGFVSKDVFRTLAYWCGAQLHALSDANLNDTLKRVDPSGLGKISFDAFYEWLHSDYEPESTEEDVSFLRFKLLMDAFAHTYGLIGTSNDSNIERKVPKPDSKTAGRKLFNVNVGVGNFDEAKACAELVCYSNAQEAAALREELSCPKEVNTYAFLEFELRSDANDEQIGEMMGMIETLLDGIPYDEMPFKIHHSHKVLDPIEKDGGRKFLRVVLFSSKDILKEMFESAKLGDVPDDVLVGRLALNIELPFSLDDFLIDPERTLTPRELAVRLAVHVDISSGFDERITDLLKAVPDDWAPYHWRLRAAMITFAREVDFQMHFSDVQSFIDHISAEGLGPGTSFREQVEALCATPIGSTIKNAFENLRSAASKQRELYNTFRRTVKGVHCVRLQMRHLALNVTLKGLDFVAFLPDLDQPPSRSD